MAPDNSAVRTGSTLMLIAGLAFIGYAVVFFIRSFTGTGFELGVETLNGVTKEQLNALNPAVVYYIKSSAHRDGRVYCRYGHSGCSSLLVGSPQRRMVGVVGGHGFPRGGLSRCSADALLRSLYL